MNSINNFQFKLYFLPDEMNLQKYTIGGLPDPAIPLTIGNQYICWVLIKLHDPTDLSKCKCCKDGIHIQKYSVTCDNGDRRRFPVEWFVTQEEFREIKLKNLFSN